MGHEYLGTLGSAEFAMDYSSAIISLVRLLLGARQARLSRKSVCGTEHANKVISLTRGCCLPWADPPRKSSDGRMHAGSAASFLGQRSMSRNDQEGLHVFVAYADPQAGERGVIFRACNFLYCGTTSPTEKFRRPDGKVYDARNVHLLTRDRRFGMLRYKRSRAQQKEILIEQGCEFFKDSGFKHRFVGIFGDRRTKRILRTSLRWQVMEYPKQAPEHCVDVVDLNPKAFAASVS